MSLFAVTHILQYRFLVKNFRCMTSREKGFGGRKYKLLLTSGQEIVTDNLRSIGAGANLDAPDFQFLMPTVWDELDESKILRITKDMLDDGHIKTLEDFFRSKYFYLKGSHF